MSKFVIPGNRQLYVDGDGSLIVNGGSVGVGTATPDELFHMLQTSGNLMAKFEASDTNANAIIQLVNDAQEWRISCAGNTSDQLIIRDQTASTTPVFIGTGAPGNSLRIEGSGDVGIGINNPTAQLHVDQSSTTGAQPVLLLDQADVDEPFLKIIGTSDTNVDRALVDAADFTTPGAIVAWYKVEVQDDQGTNPITDGDYYSPLYGAPTA
jgi:hypothetical protein